MKQVMFTLQRATSVPSRHSHPPVILFQIAFTRSDLGAGKATPKELFNLWD
jgi:hypothetical protein